MATPRSSQNDHDHSCHCQTSCFSCDATTPRQFEQSAARYNDQSAQQAIASLQDFHMQRLAAWQRATQAMSDSAFASAQMQLNAVNQMYRS